ncbi:uncharacterized protein LOC125470719 [Pyrus x bretschneideri]|uniref:uncharacterized protein LOC125470719 n=1 Tax=Pyrus x bretschneideri TaxID=225117 RepID=UPI00202E9F92|nr:uncharacterized protein LOC125470719 [Pyrus x bretschneideri]
MTQLRSISSCNVVYKVIAKILTNCMKLAMPHIISMNQLTFVAGRQIQDNVLVVHEILHSLNQQGDEDEVSVAMKLDMAKAYDCVEWSFLLAMMEAMGFLDEFRNRIAECITTVTYRFLALLRRREEWGALHGMWVVPGGMSLSHLFFANDAVIFFRAEEDEAYVVMDVLQCYVEALGQVINREKSSLYFGARCSQIQRKAIIRCTNITGKEELGKYLGIKADFGSSKKAVFEGVREVLEGRINGWAEQFLSPAGKEVLIKAVAMALPYYVMSCFKLSANLILGLPVSIGGCSDRVIWHYSKNDDYTVRTGHGVAMEMQENGELRRKRMRSSSRRKDFDRD